MKIFISWSGELSRKVAEYLKEWLGFVLQGADTFVSSEDIRKGQRWGVEVAKELEDSNFGILCLTKDNLNAPWILFEAGALSKFVKEANVSALLINGVQPADVKGPLSQFQHTNTTKEDIQKLLESINEKMGEKKLEEGRLKTVFEKWYPDLEATIRSNIESTESEVSDYKKRPEEDILAEILELTRFIASRSNTPSDFEHLFQNLNPDRGDILTSDGVLISPGGGEFNHPSGVKIYPVPVIKDGKREKLVSVEITSGGVEITEITPPFDTRGVVIVLTFWSETEGKHWSAKLQFHKGNTLIETEMDETENLEEGDEEDGNEEFFGWDTIWRD